MRAGHRIGPPGAPTCLDSSHWRLVELLSRPAGMVAAHQQRLPIASHTRARGDRGPYICLPDAYTSSASYSHHHQPSFQTPYTPANLLFSHAAWPVSSRCARPCARAARPDHIGTDSHICSSTISDMASALAGSGAAAPGAATAAHSAAAAVVCRPARQPVRSASCRTHASHQQQARRRPRLQQACRAGATRGGHARHHDELRMRLTTTVLPVLLPMHALAQPCACQSRARLARSWRWRRPTDAAGAWAAGWTTGAPRCCWCLQLMAVSTATATPMFASSTNRRQQHSAHGAAQRSAAQQRLLVTTRRLRLVASAPPCQLAANSGRLITFAQG